MDLGLNTKSVFGLLRAKQIGSAQWRKKPTGGGIMTADPPLVIGNY